MGGSMVKGFLLSQSLQPADMVVSDASQQALNAFQDTGVKTTTDNHEAASWGDVVFVVVKPWLVEPVLQDVKPFMDYQRQTLVVVAAGVASADIASWMRKDGEVAEPPLFLAIPNIAIAQKASMTFLVPISATASQTECVKALFDEVGQTIVTTEKLLPAGTALASCGIAYAMRYVRAASEGGVELGFKAADAQRIVMQTMKGAVELLQASGMHPEAAIDLVTTPGGVTIRGLNAMEEAGFTHAVIHGLKASK